MCVDTSPRAKAELFTLYLGLFNLVKHLINILAQRNRIFLTQHQLRFELHLGSP